MSHDHSFVYAGRADPRRVRADGGCVRPNVLECVCGARQIVRCDATREDRCEPCGKRHNRRLRRLIRSGFTGRPTGFFLATGTAPGVHRTANGADGIPADDLVAAAWWNGAAPQAWSWLVKEIRKLLPGHDVQFWKCWETQKRGLLHVHALIWCEGVTEDRMREVWEEARSHVYNVAGGVWGWGPQGPLDRIGTRVTVAELMQHMDEDQANSWWNELESKAIGHAAMYGAKYCTKGGKRAVTLNTSTGEIRHDGRGYRTWSASSRWGQRMLAIRAEQRAWAASAGRVTKSPDGAVAGSEATLDPDTNFYAASQLSGALPDPISGPAAV
jgi:hypothetical protein